MSEHGAEGAGLRRLRLFAALGGFVAVAMGAFGAHGLRGARTPELLTVFQTGVQYLFWHVLALLATAELWRRDPGARLLGWSASAMVAGCVLFSGSLFALVLTEQRWLGAVTPLGGLSLMLGWLLLAWYGFRGGGMRGA